jgi:hypothetical protein
MKWTIVTFLFYSILTCLSLSARNELEELDEMRELKKRLSRKVRGGRRRVREGNRVSLSIR